MTIGALAWVFNAYGISVAVGVVVGGCLGGPFGIKRMFGIGVLSFASGAALVACAGTFETLILGRVLQGFGGGVFSPLVPLLLTRALPLRPGKILIIWGSITGYVAAFAPLTVSQVIPFFGWQSVLVLFVAVSGLAFLLSIEAIPEDDPNMSTRTSPNLMLLVQAPKLWCVFGYIFCTYGVITFYLFRLPLWLTDTDYSIKLVGIVLTTIWVSFSIASTLLRNLVDGPHLKSIVLAAPLLIAASFLVTLHAGHAGWPLVSAALIGAGFACSNAPSTQLVLKFSPPGLSVISASLDITFARLGGVATVAWLAQSTFSHSVIAVTGLSLGALTCAFIFVEKPCGRTA